MLDQSFSYENFRILLDVENRKGRYLEDKIFFNSDIFKKSREISDLIIEKNQKIRIETFKIKSIQNIEDRDYTKLNKLIEEKENLKQEREKVLEEILIEIASKTDVEDYELEINKGQVKWGSQLFEIVHNPENYLVTKQLQRNIFKTFKVKQASRKIIIDQLRLLLDDAFPKIVIRTDIKKFYESIPHKELLEKIEENSLLSFPSKKIIKSVLHQYWKLLIADGAKSVNDERVGIPRGIGFSAYLSELYLRDFDNKIKSLENVTYYSRYVDDIIIIITPDHRNKYQEVDLLRDEIKNILFEKSKLNINVSKTKILDLTIENKNRLNSETYDLTYLGYKFKISYTKKGVDFSKDKLQIYMSDEKLKKFKDKVDAAFSDYSKMIVKYATQKNATERMLLKRIKFLSNNHQLFRRKSNVFIGIYFSNEFLTQPFLDLGELDEYLKDKILALPASTNRELINKLKKQSFSKGFKDKSIGRFNTNSFTIEKMLIIWNNL